MSGTYGSLIYLVGLFAIFYFLLLRPQQKKNKQLKDMRVNLKSGDHIVTIGGLVGKILKVNEDEVTVEAGADKQRMIFKTWAISSITNSIEEIE